MASPLRSYFSGQWNLCMREVHLVLFGVVFLILLHLILILERLKTGGYTWETESEDLWTVAQSILKLCREHIGSLLNDSEDEAPLDS